MLSFVRSFIFFSLSGQLFRPLAETPCHFISTLEGLVDLNEKLVGCKEFALDLEVSLFGVASFSFRLAKNKQIKTRGRGLDLQKWRDVSRPLAYTMPRIQRNSKICRNERNPELYLDSRAGGGQVDVMPSH